MGLHNIALDRFKFDPMIIKNHWLLLAAGDFKPGRAKGAFKPKPYNAMTISWASVGQIWNKLFSKSSFVLPATPMVFWKSTMDSPLACFLRR